MDITQLKSDVDALQSSVATADDELAKLAKLVGGLTPESFTQADIDALDAGVKSAKSALDSAVQSAETPPTA